MAEPVICRDCGVALLREEKVHPYGPSQAEVGLCHPCDCKAYFTLRGSECAFPECDCPGDEPVCPDYRTPAEVYGLVTERDSEPSRDDDREPSKSAEFGRELQEGQ